MTTPLQKALLISQTRCKGTVDGEAINYEPGKLPRGGSIRPESIGVPAREITQSRDGRFIHAPHRQDFEEYSPETKSRVRRNMSEAPIERLFRKNKVNQEQYGIYLIYRAAYHRAFPQQSHECREAVDGGGGFKGTEASMDAEQRVIKAGQFIKNQLSKNHLTALQMFVLDECELYQISERLGKGWGRGSVEKKVCDTLDELSRIWPLTRGKDKEQAA